MLSTANVTERRWLPGWLQVQASSPCCKHTDPKAVVGRNFLRLNQAGPGKTGTWWLFDLGANHRLICKYYTLRHDGTFDFPRTWYLQVRDTPLCALLLANNAAERLWVSPQKRLCCLALSSLLRKSRECRVHGRLVCSLVTQLLSKSAGMQGSTDGIGWVDLRQHKNDTSICMPQQAFSWPVTGHAASMPYRMFRLLLQGPTAGAAANRQAFHLSMFELYGHFFTIK